MARLVEDLETIVTRDANELREIESTLRESLSRYRTIIDGMADGIHVVDRHRKIILVNRPFTRWLKHLGLDHDIVGKTVREAFPFLPDSVRREYEQVFETGEALVSEDAVVLDGVALHTETRKIPVMQEGKSRLVITIVRDVTEKRRAQDLAIQSQKMLSVGGLAAGMAHEINNPLAVISQSCEILARILGQNSALERELAAECGVDIDGVKEYLKRKGVFDLLEGCVTGTQNVSRTMRNMLSFARSSNHQFQPCDLASLLERTIELTTTRVDSHKKIDFRKIEIDRDVQEGLPQVMCQEVEIQQVLFNLLDNAAQSMADAGVESPRIDIVVNSEAQNVVVAVGDCGPGMTEETRRRVFEPFFTTKCEGIGTGIGLSISYFIVCDHHGGTMSVESSPGRGSTFFVRLPIGEGP
jgi:PAS domain S-box-containing protein